MKLKSTRLASSAALSWDARTNARTNAQTQKSKHSSANKLFLILPHTMCVGNTARENDYHGHNISLRSFTNLTVGGPPP